MIDLNEWLEAWKPIRTSFERLSLSNSDVELGCILLDVAGIGCDRVIPDFRRGVISTHGCGARYWWIRHQKIAELFPPIGPIKEDLHLFESINEANAVAREFQNCAEHAGDLLSLLPFNLAPMFPISLSRFQEDVGKEKLNELNFSTGWVGANKQGKHLWIAALFLPTDQWPWWWPRRLNPTDCGYYWGAMVEIDNPHGIPEVCPMTLGLNPFQASVVLIDAMRTAVQGKPQPQDNFVPTEHQQDIMEALKETALSAQQLAIKLDCDRSRLTKKSYKGSLQELMEKGLVSNIPRVGYFRVDRPPSIGK